MPSKTADFPSYHQLVLTQAANIGSVLLNLTWCSFLPQHRLCFCSVLPFSDLVLKSPLPSDPTRPARPQEADQDLNFDELILDSCQAIAAATSALVKAASSAQRELVDRGLVRLGICGSCCSIIVMGMGTGFLGIAGRGKGQGALGERYGCVVIMKVKGQVCCK